MYASLVTVLDGQWLQCNIEDDYQEMKIESSILEATWRKWLYVAEKP